ncbi:MAG TPA: methyltransferase [Roseimicrobium sp.]|nr:methyltransferase [Roseimicrobium sp.]
MNPTYDFTRTPETDPLDIYRQRDGLYAVDLLTAAVARFDFFTWLSGKSASNADICAHFGFHARPVDVMLTLFASMGLLVRDGDNVKLTQKAQEHLVKGSPWNLAPYYASLKERPVAIDFETVLRTGRPANWSSLKSEKEWAKAIEDEAFANQFTAAMDCRGLYLGPALARALELSKHHRLLDIAGGSGIYSCAIAGHHLHLNATVLEKAPVDEIARRNIGQRGFTSRVSVATGEMFSLPLPADHDVHLISNVLHDWDVPKVRQLLEKSFAALPNGGLLAVHDVHINEEKTGPYPAAAYSALLSNITEGKCYSIGEMRDMLTVAGFVGMQFNLTAADRSVITARKE